MVLGIVGMLLPFLFLIYFAYCGTSVLIVTPPTALLLVLYFSLFLLGAVFGKLMDTSGCASTIAHWMADCLGKRHAGLAIVLACAVLTYGGVSLFVVAFAVYPIAAALFREAALPKRPIPTTIALGAFTFMMTALPGTPAIQNSTPMPFSTLPLSPRRDWGSSAVPSCRRWAQHGCSGRQTRPPALARATARTRQNRRPSRTKTCAS